MFWLYVAVLPSLLILSGFEEISDDNPKDFDFKPSLQSGNSKNIEYIGLLRILWILYNNGMIF